MLTLILSAAALTGVAGTSLSLVMTADPGYYSGVSEGKYILANMTNQANISTALPYCAEAVEGLVSTVPVSLVTTGIGHDAASGCMISVIGYYKARNVEIKDVIYIGTSGWSPKVGGMFNPETDPECKAPVVPDASQLVNVGDVCISPVSFLLNCGFCEWNEGFEGGQCASPACASHDQSTVFGQCDFYTPDTQLSDQLIAASKQVRFPAMNNKLSGYVGKYWAATWQGLGISSSSTPTPTPTIHDYNSCGEAASYNLWKGLPKDFQCRKYLANILSKMHGKAVTPSEVTCVSAMEGPGWMRWLLKEATQGGNIPFVGLRGASNYDSWPLVRAADGKMTTDNNWLPGNGTEDFTLEGYHYAIRTTTSIVLQHFSNIGKAL
eukprot:TRINITY_DN34169_c0_g1_i1.p1 TRINITY_DN34169_c0_g1~~TRINITY_DN34169_c0_g1_i1.p1  ORF type:complete len:380 (+),score=43.63 TRINITY_DN34169_c0_g1_i1:48-1187(+)